MVVHRFLRDIRPLWYSSWDGHAEGNMSTEGETLYLTGARYVHPWWHTEHLTKVSCTRSTVSADDLAGLFVLQCTGSHSAGISCTVMNCFVCWWFCVVHGPKPSLQHHNWLSFGKFWDTEHFLIPCPYCVSSQLPLVVKPASMPWRLVTKNSERFSTYSYAPFWCVCVGCCAAEFGSSGGTYELPCIPSKVQ
jgi:hypothetical protein